MPYTGAHRPMEDGDPLEEDGQLLEPGPVLPPPVPPHRRGGAETPILGPVPSGTRPAPGEPDDAPRFRRPDRPAPAAGDGRIQRVDDPFTASGESANGDSGLGDSGFGDSGPGASALAAPGHGAGRTMAGPLAALAAAFQANAEALRRSQEMQAELGRALQRADRSEVLLQSTGALNDTFKGLTTVQRSLLQQIDTSSKDARSGRWFLPVLVLAAMAVVGTGLWLVVHRMQEMERDVVGNGDIATQLSLAFDRGREQGTRDGAASSSPEVEGLRGRVQRLEADLLAASTDRDAKTAALAASLTDRGSLEGEVMLARNDSIRMKAVEQELNRMRAEAAVRDPDAERSKRDLAEERRINADLRQKLATLGLGKMPVVGPEDDAALPSAPPREPGPAGDALAPNGVELARARMNELLQSGGASRSDYLQVAKIGGARTNRLTDVLISRYGTNGRLINFIKARDLRIVVDRLNRTVEFVFTDGSMETNGTSLPFPGGTFTKVVAEGDLVSQWTASGFTFLASK